MLSSARNFIEITDMLAKNKANVNAKDNTGKTALMYACMNSHDDIVAYLIGAAKADLHAQDKDGRTAEDYAMDIANIVRRALKAEEDKKNEKEKLDGKTIGFIPWYEDKMKKGK